MPKKKKKKKKSWKERQRERQIRQQRAQEACEMERKRETAGKPRKWPKGKILGAICLLVLILGAYGVWQYTKPSAISEELPPTSGAIYIKADGSVDPSTASILNVGNIYYTFTADIHDVIVIQRDNIVVDGANYTLQGTGANDSKGIDLTGRRNVTITNIEIREFDCGVYLYSASLNVISQNDLTDNYCGILLEYSSNNTLNGNNITDSYGGGIVIYYSSNNCIFENIITGSYYYGIDLLMSSDNKIYHNGFIENIVQAHSDSSTSFWDDGYPSGGNYWSDYEENYPDADELDGSGIWNTPYVIDSNNKDNYPLMNL